MPADNERVFQGALKSIQLKGELKHDKDGEVTQEPEVHITVAFPLDKESIAAMGFLAACKKYGECYLTIGAMQGTLNL